MIENNEYKKIKEIIRKTDIIFVLAQGNPPEEKLTMEAKLRVLGALEAKNINPDLNIVFVGGHVKNFDTTSKQMSDYFNARIKNSNTAVLDKSNNTVGNIKEIIEYLKQHTNFQKIGIISSFSHLKRTSEILKNLEQNYELIPFEPLVKERRPKIISETGKNLKHKELVEKYEHSWNYNKLKLIDKLMIIYLKFDKDHKLVRKYRKFTRDIKEKLKK